MNWLMSRKIKTTRPSKKLDNNQIQPFKILAKSGTSAYKLAPPPSVAIYNTFDISILETYQDNGFPPHIKEPSHPIQVEGEDEYELNERIDSPLQYNKLHYLAKWRVYSPEHQNVWYLADNFNHEEHAVPRFHQHLAGTPGVDTRHYQQIVLRTSSGHQTRKTLAHRRA